MLLRTYLAALLYALTIPSASAQFFSQISSASSVLSHDLAVDVAGNSYVTGGFIGTATFEHATHAITLTSAGLKDIFLTKYSPEGQPLWAFSIGGVAAGPGLDDEGLGVAVSAAGDVFITGYFQGIADFDPSSDTFMLSSQGFRDAFVASYTSDGELRWAKSFGGIADDRGNDVAVYIATDKSEDIYFTGLFREEASLSDDNTNSTVESNGEEDAFLIRLDENTDLEWMYSYGSTSVDIGKQVKTDDSGRVYLLGTFSRTVNVAPPGDSFVLSSVNNSQDGLLVSYHRFGILRWAFPIGGPLFDDATALTVSTLGVYITGHFSGTVNFNPWSTTPRQLTSTDRDLYVAAYTGGGHLTWAHNLGSGFAQGSAVSVNDSHNLLVTGIFLGDVFPDPKSALILEGAGEQSALFASYNIDGLYRWAYAIGGPQSVIPTSAHLSDSDNIILTGYFDDTVDFAPQSGSVLATSAGVFDGFLAQYASDGSLVVSVEEEAPDEHSLNIFPNPATQQFTLELNDSPEPRSIMIYDALGREVFTSKIAPLQRRLIINTAQFAAGTYYVRLSNSSQQIQSFTILK